MEIKIDETYHVASCCCPKFAHEVSGKIVSFIFPRQELYLYHTQKKRHLKKTNIAYAGYKPPRK